MPLYWFKGPVGEPFQFQCGPDGIHVPGLADKVKLKPRPLELNGVVVDFDKSSGYLSMQDAQEFIQGLGGSTETAIPVDGQPAGAAAGGTAAPAAAAAAGAGATGIDIEVLEEAVLRALKRQKASEASISNFSTEQWSRMALAAGLTMRVYENLEVDEGSCKEAPAFQWNYESEPKQADRYMAHLKQVITISNRTHSPLVWLEAGSKRGSLLDTKGFEELLHYSSITGNTDAAIVTRASMECLVPKDGLCVLFELKKEVKQSHVYQAACQLVLANLASQFNPVVILTDLAEHWQLFWLNESTVWHTKLASRRAALTIIQGCVAAAEAACMPSSMALSQTLPQVVADRKASFLSQRVIGAVRREEDAQLLSLADQLPPEDAHEVYASVLLRQLSMQPALCGFSHDAAPLGMFS